MEQAECFTAHVGTMSDEEMIEFVNAGAEAQGRTFEAWARDCS